MILQISPDTHDHNRIKNVKDYFKSTLILLYLLVYARMSRRACPTLRRLAGRLYSSLGRTAVPGSSHGRKGLTCRSGSCGRSLHLRQTLSCRRQMVPGNKQIILFFFCCYPATIILTIMRVWELVLYHFHVFPGIVSVCFRLVVGHDLVCGWPHTQIMQHLWTNDVRNNTKHEKLHKKND